MRTTYMTIGSTIGVGGLVHHRSPLGPRELSVAIRHDEYGIPSIELVDVLAMMRVDANAEVLVAVDAAGYSIAIPIRQILSGGHARITFVHDQTEEDDEQASAECLILSVNDWTDDRPPFRIASLHALSFSAFVTNSSSVAG